MTETKMDANILTNIVKSELHALNRAVESVICRELSTQFDLGHSGKLQFEIDPLYFRIHLIQTEEEILESFSLSDDIEYAAEELSIDVTDIICKEIVEWFSARWIAASGPSHFSPAYVFFHGGLEMPRFDMENRLWCLTQDVWPELHNG